MTIATRFAPQRTLPPPLERDPNPGVVRAVLHGCYDLLWFLAIGLSAPWWLGRSLFDAPFRGMVLRRLTVGLPKARSADGKKRILIHGVSVGEVKASQALVEGLRRDHPDWEVVVCTTTNTGLEVARKLFAGLEVVGFPIDVGFLVRRFLRRTRPDCVVLIELEIWPNFLRWANRYGIPIAVVNGRITEGSFGNYLYFRSALPQFNRISLFCAQDESYAQRFAGLARTDERIVVTGNIKVDGLKTGAVEPAEELRRLVGPAPGQTVVVAGSTHEREEVWVVEACRQCAHDLRIVLVPRHPDRTRDVVRALEAIGEQPQLLTRLRAGAEAPAPSRPVVVDTIGELEQIYGLADVVFIGGSLIDHGGQNMLEPAAQGKPVIYGPSVQNFAQEAAMLERAGASRKVEGATELGPALAQLLDDPGARDRMAQAGIEVVEAQRGATELTLAALARHCLSRN